ncbi:MAG: Fe-S cluster assembly protein HesB [Candidatus Zixiibacteriota bacterium]|nr:MAG: Fe-S cluster assembly protein HesB [candidate division Zixibacteria bacterium]
MLQQTQASRVVPKYLAWIEKWPSWKQLAKATNRQLLTAWVGLGYNRRALFLGQLAKKVVSEFDGKLPNDPDTLQSFPGIGPYTARAILIFAYNMPLITVDTNIRRVILHEFGLPGSTIREQLEVIAQRLLPKNRSRDWHNALMDYSRIFLPRRLANLPPLTKQSRFPDSRRQIRGEIIRWLTIRNRINLASLLNSKHHQRELTMAALKSLQKDGLVVVQDGTIRLT